MPSVAGRIVRQAEGVRAQGFHPLQVRFQREQRAHDRIVHQVNHVIVRQVRRQVRPLVGAEVVLAVARGLEGQRERSKLVRLAGLQVAVRGEDDFAQGPQRLQIAERRFPHHALRVVECEQEQAFHRYGASRTSAKLPGTGLVAAEDL